MRRLFLITMALLMLMPARAYSISETPLKNSYNSQNGITVDKALFQMRKIFIYASDVKNAQNEANLKAYILTHKPKVIHKQQQVLPSPISSGITSGLAWHNGALCYRGCISESLPCAIPEYICHREARFIDQKNSSSSASGKYQIVDGTWGGFDGYIHAGLAPESVQDQKARDLWNGGDCSAWSAC